MKFYFYLLLGLSLSLYPLKAEEDRVQTDIDEAIRVLTSTDGDSIPVKCAFGLVHALRSVPAGDVRIRSVSDFLSRPSLPLELVSPRGLFRIHYTISGTDAIPTDDTDFSGLPDYIETAAVVMDSVYHVEVEQLGFRPPPNDPVAGPEWDIYIRNIPGTYGYTREETQISDNPPRFTSYIEMDNNYTHTYTKGLNGFRVTAAHEFLHMIQLGINAGLEGGSYRDYYIMEASATWMEDQVFDGINDYYNYLTTFFQKSRLPFDYSDGWREYGLSLWFHFLDQRFGWNGSCRAMWEKMDRLRAMEALREVINENHRHLEDEMALFYAWNCMTGSRADSIQFYPEGALYPEVKATASVDFNWDATLSDSLRSTAAAYYLMRPEGADPFFLVPVNVDFSASDYDYGSFTLSVIRGGGHDLYTDLDGLEARIIADPTQNWGCHAALSNPEPALIQVSGSEDGFAGLDNETLPPAYPNPFMSGSHVVRIPFIPRDEGSAQVRIFTASGYPVWESEMNGKAGTVNWFVWDGKDSRGATASSGIYPYVIFQDQILLRKAAFAVIR